MMMIITKQIPHNTIKHQDDDDPQNRSLKIQYNIKMMIIHRKTETAWKRDSYLHLPKTFSNRKGETSRRKVSNFAWVLFKVTRYPEEIGNICLNKFANLHSGKNSMMLGSEPWKVDAGDVELADGEVDGVQVGPGVVGDWSGVWDLSGVPLLYKQLLNQRFKL